MVGGRDAIGDRGDRIVVAVIADHGYAVSARGGDGVRAVLDGARQVPRASGGAGAGGDIHGPADPAERQGDPTPHPSAGPGYPGHALATGI